MILNAGLTPAWQQILVFDEFHAGEVNRARQAVWCASGKVLNAGIAAHHLGGPSITLAPLGGPALHEITAEFESLGVPYRWIPTSSPTRVCTTILDRGAGKITELVENGRPLLPEELDAFRQVYAELAARADCAVLIGSLPLGTPDSFYRELLEQTPCPVVLDFRGSGLIGVLDLEPELVKPNREELAQTLGQSLNDDDQLLAAMRSLNAQGARWVLVTQGDQPIWLTSTRQIYRLQPPPLRDVVNPIASGDAMAATIAWGLRAGRAVVDAVRLGAAAAAQNVGQLLPCRLDPSRLEAAAAAISVEQLE